MTEELLGLIMDGDRDRATLVIKEWAKDHTYRQAIVDVLNPVLETFGREWGHGDGVSLGQGYVLSKVAEDIFNLAAEEQNVSLAGESGKGPIVIGNIFDDSHGLGRKLVITFLKLDGWAIYDLGNDVTAEDLVDKAEEVSAPIIGVSAMMLRTAMNIAEVRAEIDRRGLTKTIKLAVGGAVFVQRPTLVEEVGADGTAINAIGTPALMSRLLEAVKAGE